MKKSYRIIIWVSVYVLLWSSISGCTREELEKSLQEDLYLQWAKEPEEESEESELRKNPDEDQGEEASGQDDEGSGQQEEDIPKKQEEVKQIQRISDEKYAYRQLNAEEQMVYDEMLSLILKQEEKTFLSTTDTDVMKRAYTAICSDYGGLFWVNGYVFTRYTKGGELVNLEFSPKYTMTRKERSLTQELIDRVVEEWFTGISINDTDYAKAKYVYEILALNTEYVENAEDSQNIISVFLRRKTVCQGYACAVQYLLEQLGVQSMIVSGKALGEPHAWNLICLDGEYYFMDATWGNNGYRNKEGEETSFIDYNYMTMTTEEMRVGHEPDMEIDLPECTAVLNNYYIKEGKYIEEWQPDQIGAMLAAAWEEKRVITLRFSDDSLKEQTFLYFIEEGHAADYCAGLSRINYLEDNSWKEISFCFNQS